MSLNTHNVFHPGTPKSRSFGPESSGHRQHSPKHSESFPPSQPSHYPTTATQLKKLGSSIARSISPGPYHPPLNDTSSMKCIPQLDELADKKLETSEDTKVREKEVIAQDSLSTGPLKNPESADSPKSDIATFQNLWTSDDSLKFVEPLPAEPEIGSFCEFDISNQPVTRSKAPHHKTFLGFYHHV
jgi:hypothetical protein